MKYNSAVLSEQSFNWLPRNDVINRWGNVLSHFQIIPGLVGLWPLSSIRRSTGDVYDMSGQTRALTRNGNPVYNIYNNTMPYIDLDGTGDFLSRADETDLDILGTETTNAAAVRGLSMGGWFRFDRSNADEGLMGKWLTTGNQKGYDLFRPSGGTVEARISTDGSAETTVASAVLATNTWHFVAGTFDPSTSLNIFADGVTVSNTSSIPASIFNNTANLIVGGTEDGGSPLSGLVSVTFLSANFLPGYVINALYQNSRVLFNV